MSTHFTALHLAQGDVKHPGSQDSPLTQIAADRQASAGDCLQQPLGADAPIHADVTDQVRLATSVGEISRIASAGTSGPKMDNLYYVSLVVADPHWNAR
ncbi:hypothetical protein [Leucobacter sp. GX24907]